jgi:hypothetical protein
MSFLLALFLFVLGVGILTGNPVFILVASVALVIWWVFKVTPSWFEALIYTIMILGATFFMMCNFFNAIR